MGLTCNPAGRILKIYLCSQTIETVDWITKLNFISNLMLEGNGLSLEIGASESC